MWEAKRNGNVSCGKGEYFPRSTLIFPGNSIEAKKLKKIVFDRVISYEVCTVTLIHGN